jgi:hypothetical protein
MCILIIDGLKLTDRKKYNYDFDDNNYSFDFMLKRLMGKNIIEDGDYFKPVDMDKLRLQIQLCKDLQAWEKERFYRVCDSLEKYPDHWLRMKV